jgi:hypothetical protein
MGLIPYGLNPDETWEIDFAAERAKSTVQDLRGAAARVTEKDATAAKRIEEQAAALEAELAAYVPGSGPVFVVGPIPNGMRAEIAGEAQALGSVTDDVEHARRDVAWSEKVIRWAVRGHRNLRTARGAEVAFEAEEVEWDGRKRKLVARPTLEAYQPILGDLALACLRSQRLDEAGKNA